MPIYVQRRGARHSSSSCFLFGQEWSDRSYATAGSQRRHIYHTSVMYTVDDIHSFELSLDPALSLRLDLSSVISISVILSVCVSVALLHQYLLEKTHTFHCMNGFVSSVYVYNSTLALHTVLKVQLRPKPNSSGLKVFSLRSSHISC